MHRIKYIIQKEFRQIRRDRPMLIILFLLPIVQLLILGYVVSSEVKNIRTVICDLDNTPLSRDLVGRLINSGYFDVKYFEASESQLPQYFDLGKAMVALVIPRHFARDLARNKPTQIQVLMDGQDSNSAVIAMGYIGGILENFLTDRLTRQMAEYAGVLDIHLVTPVIRVWYNEDLKYSNFMVPGIVVFLLTMVTSLVSAMGLVRERELGTLEQLLVAPIKKHELLIGKLIPFAILGFVVLTLGIALAKVWYDIPIVGNLGLIALFSFLYLFSTLGIGLFVSASARTQQQAMFMTFFLLVFFMLMSGFFVPIENMPESIQYVTYLNPMRYFMLVVREVFIKGANLSHLYWQGIALLIFGSGIFTFATMRFQKRMK
ncbi:ABC transporter permease [candidate division KSB1 bacterium]|nr:ABC transporter permease [candidate division KSB1 bacterium]